MFKQLFFDDQRLFLRENTKRHYGTPQWVGHYSDPTANTSYGWSWGVKGPDGKIHLLYFGTKPYSEEYYEHHFRAAISDDGIHFVPRNTAAEAGLENPECPNQLLPVDTTGSEIATVIVDEHAQPNERYKILFADNHHLDKYYVEDYVLASPDLIHWHRINNSCWNPYGTEPVMGAFYNDVAGKFTILSRPHWGQRRVGVTDTADWHYFSPLELCLQCDSLDQELAEIYGMPAIAYDGWFIGFPHMYSNLPHIRDSKSKGGTMHCELAYSLNGHHWQRSLRTPFISLDNPGIVSAFGKPAKMTYIGSVVRMDDGSMLLYGGANTHEHGTPPKNVGPGETGVEIFRLREDGFVALSTANPAEESIITSRDIVWESGLLNVNIQAESATCALYTHEDGESKVIPGFDHCDCTQFSGDSTKWVPQWKGGSIEQFAGKGMLIEVKFRNGTIYSFSGDCTPRMFADYGLYSQYGLRLDRKGF